ncbi:MAG: cyclic nucleotide-binding domain-containing protein [Pseudomonadota bacterium]
MGRNQQNSGVSAMTSTNENVTPVIHLKYRKGDLISKEGDYGISIYKIIEGKTLIYHEAGDKEISFATLGPGDVFGEVTFLTSAEKTCSASVRAIEDSVLEVWHPSMLLKEYEQMPPMIKYITDQILSRLIRMNNLIVQLTTHKQRERKAIEKSDPLTSERRFYRKKLDLDCHYRPVGISPKVRLVGRIKDISLGGLGMEIDAKNTTSFSHMQDDSFVINAVLPNGKSLELEAKVVTVIRSETPGRLLLGMAVTELSAGAEKLLGFFLMP